jgi:hypothetical protein
MKPVLSSQRLLSALALTSLLSLGVGVATAQAQTVAPSAPAYGRTVRLPRSVATAVRQDLGQQLNRSPQSFIITQATRTVWPDGCLGIVNPAALCSQGQVNGWQVEVQSDNGYGNGSGNQTWVYRTDFNGRRLALDPINAERAALRAAAQRVTTRLQVVSTTQQTWSNGCLDLPLRGISCRQVPVTGFRITLAGGNSQLVYHTDATGNSVFLNEQASRIAGVNGLPVNNPDRSGDSYNGNRHRWDRRDNADRYPRGNQNRDEPAQTSAFPANVLFRSVTSGGIMGRQSTVDLMADGRLISDPGRGQTPSLIRRLSAAEIQAFERQLRDYRFSQLQGRSFAPPTGAADFFGYQLSDVHGAVDFADGSAIPADLRAIAGLWQQLVAR